MVDALALLKWVPKEAVSSWRLSCGTSLARTVEVCLVGGYVEATAFGATFLLGVFFGVLLTCVLLQCQCFHLRNGSLVGIAGASSRDGARSKDLGPARGRSPDVV